MTEKYLIDYHKLSEVYAKQNEWYDLEATEEIIELLDLSEIISTDLKRQIKQNSKQHIKLGIKDVSITFINGEELEIGISVESVRNQNFIIN